MRELRFARIDQAPPAPIDYYMEYLASYTTNTPEAQAQPQEVSDSAAAMVLRASGYYPSSSRSVILIADHVMSSFTDKPGSDIGIREVAQLYPDPVFCAGIINRYHASFGIDYRVLPGEAAGATCARATDGLELLRERTIEVAMASDLVVPELVTGGRMWIRHRDAPPAGPWSVNRGVAFALHDLLTARPDLCTAVADGVRAEAAELRSASAEQRCAVVARYAARKATGNWTGE